MISIFYREDHQMQVVVNTTAFFMSPQGVDNFIKSKI
jgi:hypothetical protein